MTDRSVPPRPATAPRIIAHRGASAVAPENTLAAISRAKALGATWVEVDVSLLGDATPVLMHDATLDRTTDAAGALSTVHTAALDGIDAGSWFSPAFAGEPVPTLAQALDATLGHGLSINLEMKPHGAGPGPLADAVAAALAARPSLAGRVTVSSFDHAALRALRAAAPLVPVAPLYVEPLPGWPETAAVLKAEAVHCHYRAADAALVEAVHAAGLALRVYTVNDPALVADLDRAGLDAVVTDVPDTFLAEPAWSGDGISPPRRSP